MTGTFLLVYLCLVIAFLTKYNVTVRIWTSPCHISRHKTILPHYLRSHILPFPASQCLNIILQHKFSLNLYHP
jgi:hypothetical protein